MERCGVGFFKHGDSFLYEHPIALRTYNRHNGGGFPTPQMERLDLFKDNKKWFCAYKTIEEFQAWVLSEEVKFFISEGFRVLLLNVTEYQEGKKQVIFTKESITTSEDITTLFVK